MSVTVTFGSEHSTDYVGKIIQYYVNVVGLMHNIILTSSKLFFDVISRHRCRLSMP